MPEYTQYRFGTRISQRGTGTGAIRGVAYALVAVAVVPALLVAQTGAGGGGVTIRRTTRPAALNKVCAELASAPSALVQRPSGRALLGLKMDLEGAAIAIESRADPAQRLADGRRVAAVRHGVDSLMQVVVRTIRDDSGRTQTLFTVEDSRGTSRGGAVAALRTGAQGASQAERLRVEASIRSLEPQIAALTAGGAGATRIPMPTGWLGVYLSRSAREVPTPEGVLTYYCEYPVIEAVNAGSPAAKGGLLAGDTLIAYNGRDVTTAAVNLTTLLVPSNVVRVRYQREGRSGEVPLTIVPRPPSQDRVAFQRVLCAPGKPCDPRGAITIVMDSLYTRRMEPSMRPTFMARGGYGRLEATPSPVPPAPGMDVVLRGTGIGVLMGAQLSVIDDEFATAMGVEPGVMVMRAPSGSLAAEAGLRPGEVIRAVNGIPIRELATLSRALSVPGVREVRLTVSGKGAAPRIAVVRF